MSLDPLLPSDPAYDRECSALATICRKHGLFEVALCFEELRLRRDAPSIRGFENLDRERIAFGSALVADIAAYAGRLR